MFVTLIFLPLLLIGLVVYWFFGTEIGMSIRSTGINPNMSRAQGINTNAMIILGLGILKLDKNKRKGPLQLQRAFQNILQVCEEKLDSETNSQRFRHVLSKLHDPILARNGNV